MDSVAGGSDPEGGTRGKGGGQGGGREVALPAGGLASG